MSESEELYQAPTLDTLSDSQIAAIRKIPGHDAAKPNAIESTQPALHFVDPAHFELERERVFNSAPVVVALSSDLPREGSRMAQDGYGVPVLLTRSSDGKARAFLNACQHKGAKLVEGQPQNPAARITCPYHAWSYDMEGNLVGVPREETFCGLDKSKRGLAPLPCHEKGGMIWVKLDPQADQDFDLVNDELVQDFDALGIPQAHIFGKKTFHLKANWKVVLEPFLEGYHVQRLHAKSIGRLYADVPNVTDQLGLHIRQISGKANFTPDCLDIPGENVHKSVTHAYQVFPNTVVVTSPYYISVMLLMPNAVNQTTVDYYMLTQTPPTSDKVQQLYDKSYEMILHVFGEEDFYAAELTQEGLASGALQDVVYGGLEETIPLYNKTLQAYMS